ncbi:Adenosylcobalamin biosynthesis, ATP:cob(I)alamin adenosyltransferase-like protein [Mycotypha africana]|uniref:Adenosylcobalamin biosynthesis, ATP:cob(I)alamin adenosyltransferase-like protein n=1 Tax=Mycotypha africana TaxID=64632 RepID=UPI00230138DC|nr:Adenosylcobalamin biosynthesis, ATP:cob(I)alamin adenosyltransferase-like protein [Mycotypha africana]KAI8977507.1 Adenosylcobalamin biosynthesis, ATP:cob(I)alamin adenosyltransferase-like protein [Mycotypha africana]
MRIYTKTGDKGTSSLYNGQRKDKDDDVFEALGTTDELTSTLGLAIEFLEEEATWGQELVEKLTRVQCLLQDMGSNIATPRDSSNDIKLAKTQFDPEGVNVATLEEWIDHYDEQLPKLTKFILPSGGKASASLHMARSICRRAERRVHPLIREEQCDSSVGVYLNRLSDFIFIAARWAAQCQGKPEKIYQKV